MPSLYSVTSNVSHNTFNTTNTGDRTVQASNKQRARGKTFKASPRIAEGTIYGLGSSDSSSFYGNANRLSCSDTSSEVAAPPNKAREIKYDLSGGKKKSKEVKYDLSGGKKQSRRAIEYDLSGQKSSDELRREMNKTFEQMDKREGRDDCSQLTKHKENESWFGYLLCQFNDTTNDASTLATVPVDDSVSTSSTSTPVTDNDSRTKARAVNRHGSISTPVSDAALLANVRKGSHVTSAKKQKSLTKSQVENILQENALLSPTEIGVASEGVESLDIVMELQLEEDLLKGSLKNKRKSVYRKKEKTSKNSKGKTKQLSKNNDINTSPVEIKSVLSERSLFSFASSIHPKENSPDNHIVPNFGNSVCITGPINGTFSNITSAQMSENHEIVETYNRFRVFERSVDMVLNRVATSVPLYHWKGNQSMHHGHLNTSSSSMDLSLTSFSQLDLRTPSMKSVMDTDYVPQLEHVCSEPSAKGFKVRSQSYLVDGKKCRSGESMFALLGADSVIKSKLGKDYIAYDVSKGTNSYLSRLTVASKRLGLKAPFLFIVNFVVPWGNLISYFYRPDATKGGPLCSNRKNHASEQLWERFLKEDESFRNATLKFIPQVVEGPWALRRVVSDKPAIIGQKIPTTYYGSIEDGYLEVCMDVTKGGKMANSICSAVASKARVVSIDLAFLLQGTTRELLPEQLLSVVRLHHVNLKKKKTQL